MIHFYILNRNSTPLTSERIQRKKSRKKKKKGIYVPTFTSHYLSDCLFMVSPISQRTHWCSLFVAYWPWYTISMLSSECKIHAWDKSALLSLLVLKAFLVLKQIACKCQGREWVSVFKQFAVSLLWQLLKIVNSCVNNARGQFKCRFSYLYDKRENE